MDVANLTGLFTVVVDTILPDSFHSQTFLFRGDMVLYYYEKYRRLRLGSNGYASQNCEKPFDIVKITKKMIFVYDGNIGTHS